MTDIHRTTGSLSRPRGGHMKRLAIIIAAALMPLVSMAPAHAAPSPAASCQAVDDVTGVADTLTLNDPYTVTCIGLPKNKQVWMFITNPFGEYVSTYPVTTAEGKLVYTDTAWWLGSYTFSLGTVGRGTFRWYVENYLYSVVNAA